MERYFICSEMAKKTFLLHTNCILYYSVSIQCQIDNFCIQFDNITIALKMRQTGKQVIKFNIIIIVRTYEPTSEHSLDDLSRVAIVSCATIWPNCIKNKLCILLGLSSSTNKAVRIRLTFGNSLPDTAFRIPFLP